MKTRHAISLFLALTIVAPGTGAAEEDVLPLSDATVGTPASVTYGPYIRAELGGVLPELSDGNWLPPGSNDPRVFFDLGGENTGLAGIAVGFDWQNGFRSDLALMRTGNIDFSGPCVFSTNGFDCETKPHADITGGSVQTTAMMLNLFYSPLEAAGSNATFQPWVTAGIGVARNTVNSWTRENTSPPASQPVRTFGSNSQDEFAWSVGIGASWQLTEPGERPILLDVGWGYYDFGMAEGGSTSIVEGGVPRQPLNFELSSQVFSIGIRMPLRRY